MNWLLLIIIVSYCVQAFLSFFGLLWFFEAVFHQRRWQIVWTILVGIALTLIVGSIVQEYLFAQLCWLP